MTWGPAGGQGTGRAPGSEALKTNFLSARALPRACLGGRCQWPAEGLAGAAWDGEYLLGQSRAPLIEEALRDGQHFFKNTLKPLV